MQIVKTKEELKLLKENNTESFVVVGELAKKLNRASKIKKLSKTAVTALAVTAGAGVVAAPFTGGTSLGFSALSGGTAAAVGLSPGIIYAAIATGGILFTYALYKEYNVKVRKTKDGDIELEFNRK